MSSELIQEHNTVVFVSNTGKSWLSTAQWIVDITVLQALSREQPTHFVHNNYSHVIIEFSNLRATFSAHNIWARTAHEQVYDRLNDKISEVTTTELDINIIDCLMEHEYVRK